MNFTICDSNEMKMEEEALHVFAKRISLKKTGVDHDRDAVEKFLLPIFESKGIHSSDDDNFISLAILCGCLDPTGGPCRFFPQHSPHWLAFRRLFLKVCDQEIPESMKLPESRGGWERFSAEEQYRFFEIHTRGKKQKPSNENEFLKKQKFADKLKPLNQRTAINEDMRRRQQEFTDEINFRMRSNLPNFDEPKISFWDSFWDSNFAEELSKIKAITEIRLKNYAGISLDAMKDSLCDTGAIQLDEGCGSLYEVQRNIPLELVPDSIELSPPISDKTTVRVLKGIVDEGGIKLDFDEGYKKAARSVRAVLFDMATEATFGGVRKSDMDFWRMEKLFCERCLVENPYSMISDERIIFFVADGMAKEGGKFMNRIGSMLTAADKKGVRLRYHPVKLALVKYWLHPQFPLWLMTMPAIVSFLKIIGVTAKYDLTETVREFTKSRSKSPKSALFRSSRQLIRKLEIRGRGKAHMGMVFPKYVQKAKSFQQLQAHVSNLTTSDVDSLIDSGS